MSPFFSIEKILKIHEYYQSLIAYEERRILDLEKFIEENLGITKACDDLSRRLEMLRLATHNGEDTHTWRNGDANQLYFDIILDYKERYVDYSQWYYDSILKTSFPIMPVEYPIERVMNEEDIKFEKRHAKSGIKALIKIGDIYYRQTNSKIKIKPKEPDEWD